MSKSLHIKYHYAHIATQGEKVSTVNLIDPAKNMIIINDSMLGEEAIFVRFSSKAIKSIFDEKRENGKLDIDLYSGIVGLDTQGYNYHQGRGYFQNICGTISLKNTEDFGYVVESPPRLATLFIKKLAVVESFQDGKVKIYVSSLDSTGYIDFLFGEGVLTLARIAEPSPLPPFGEMVIKEVREQKDELPALSTIEEVPIEVIGQHHETDVTLHS
ncbi:hypothetical protein UFOVP51_39 [uncultured Caudovirales phage]|uniref:Uncharacterized protein n=1 Tax=uncultured Caudovirales phage TaxID=2100421 RepID=A0A6J5KQG6_9CAUD|nr:hypothetical protein UFOVP51_39 [uncultured Caudovirales phage]CAB4241054.1 hypothetical protein UFOVP34_67 [uncultured Caudovirales phage]